MAMFSLNMKLFPAIEVVLANVDDRTQGVCYCHFHAFISHLTVPVYDGSPQNPPVPLSAPHRWKSFEVLSRYLE